MSGSLQNIMLYDVCFIDFDNDGFLDICVAGEAVEQNLRTLRLKTAVSVFLTVVSIHLAAQDSGVTFKDVTKRAGIDFRYTFGDHHYENILESSGSGVTIFDYNNDQLMDVYMMNGTFIEGVSSRDGIVFRDTRDKLYKNNGNGTFTDITESLGLAGPEKLNSFLKWSIGVSYWDYNNDGRLDLMVGNFLAFDPAKLGELYMGALYNEIRKWLQNRVKSGPVGIPFSAGVDGDENMKDYPIEENPELTIRSVLNNLLCFIMRAGA